eukprot:CAMPEP_0115557562 /NCGR_PEP_ID=MMETSP0271-20121206/98976_1 /TAXON_ID=71861 /ORGANISM="Scrippsiella trochoidea, Strain CCMP3099" /LENGTH=42 /DNA_ID= /DNA_START= /DNA_END= /DNA_ORIENTATION=
MSPKVAAPPAPPPRSGWVALAFWRKALLISSVVAPEVTPKTW